MRSQGHCTSAHIQAKLLASCMLLLVAAAVAQGDQIITNGQQLADAVAAWGSQGGDVVLLLEAPYISMRNATFTPVTGSPGGNMAFSSGQMTFRGKPSSIGNVSILDAAMRSGLLPVQGAKLVLERVVTINNCETPKIEVQVIGPETRTLGSFFGAGLVRANQGIQQVFYNLSMVFMRPAELSRQVYMKTMPRIDFPPIQATLAPMLSNYPQRLLVVSYIRPHEVLVKVMKGPANVLFDTITMSVDHPTDPVLQWVRAKGLLRPPQFCNGTLLPPELVHARMDPVSPAWIVSNTSDFLDVLSEAARFTRRPAAKWRPPPELVLTSNVSLAASVPGQQSSWTFDTHVLIIGPFNDDPDYQLTVQLDLQDTNNTLRLGSGAQLFLQQLVLTRLAQRPLPTSPSISSALPLAAIIPPPGTDPIAGVPYVWLHNVTLVLPPDDYLALASLALADTPAEISRCLDAGLTARAAQLRPGTQAISTTAVSSDLQWLKLSSFHGWGMNATDLRIVPTSPVPQFNECKGASASSQCGGLSCSKLAGVIAGSVVACLLLIGVALLARRKLGKTQAKAVGSSAVGLDSHVPPTVSVVVEDARTAQKEPSGTELSPCPVQSAFANRIASISDLYTTYSSSQPSPGARSASSTSGATSLQITKRLIQRAASQLGDEANQVTMTSVLGQGSFGYVYRGVWRGLDVAVKTVVFEEFVDQQPTTRHTRAIMEAAIAASVGHRNLVCTYHHDIKAVQESEAQGVGGLQVVMASTSDSDQPADIKRPQVYKLFLVQELCDLTLKDGIENHLLQPVDDPVTQQIILMILMDIASGLEYLHSNSIIHGDLKPDNIMLKVNVSDDLSVSSKLTDFGLSTHLAGNATHVSNMHCGTPFYVAPEVLAKGHVSRSADVYSFGVVMWQCLTSCRPYTKAGDGHTWNPNFPALDGPLCHMRAPCATLLSKCLQHDIQRRPTAGELKRELEIIQLNLREHWRLAAAQLA